MIGHSQGSRHDSWAFIFQLFLQREEMALQSFSRQMSELWDGWEIRVLVLFSLLVQIILIIFGSKRKYTRIWINLLVWLAYLVADMVATFALGCLARYRGDSEANTKLKLQAFWAPFLLLHLGGPDTITAYSLNDNELWLRHFLQFGFQVGVAFYVFIPSWNEKDAFRFLAIPMFVSGILKYGERILVLWSSSAKQFKVSLRSSPDFNQDSLNAKHHEKKERLKNKSMETVNNYLIEAVSLFKNCRCLYADLILDHYERKESYSIINKDTAKEAFKLVAVELGFLYDVLYTKTTIIYSGFGIFLRCIYLFLHIFVVVVFLVIVDKSSYFQSDISITYILLVGAIFLEVYAFVVLLFSDWTKLWLTKCNYVSIDTCSAGLLSNDNRRWSGSMGQWNLLSFSFLECKSDVNVKVQKLFGIRELIKKYKHLTWKEVDDGLLEKIFHQLRKKSEKIKEDCFDIKECKNLLSWRSDNVFSEQSHLNQFQSTTDVEFDYSLLVWHIATDLCYESGPRKADGLLLERKISKWLSNYMLYLLVVHPTMLPKGIGEIRYRDTCLEAVRYFKSKSFGSFAEACNSLLDESTSTLDGNNMNKSSLSVLVNGCKLAKQLLENDNGSNYEWKMISEVWMEMLAHAASSCGWKEHGEQLMNGGELVTHVCLLMAHLGLSAQYQIQEQPIHQHWSTKLFEELLPSILWGILGFLAVLIYILWKILCFLLHILWKILGVLIYILWVVLATFLYAFSGFCCCCCCCNERLVEKVFSFLALPLRPFIPEWDPPV